MNAVTNNQWSTLTAPQALALYAPVATAALNDLIAASAALDEQPRLAALLREICAQTLSLTALAHSQSSEVGAPIANWRTSDVYSADERVALAFAEQLSIDVSSLDERLRAQFLQSFGGQAFPVAIATYIADFTPRLRRTLEQLFRPAAEGWVAMEGDADKDAVADKGAQTDFVTVFMEFLRVVYNMHGLDPVLTELVRLRGARQHQCRMCQSLRAHSALAAGADDAAFAAVDHYANSDLLSTRQKAALALTDAMIWQPGFIAVTIIEGIHQHFSPAEAVELVLDIMRNAANKPAVALGSDAASSDGVQVYDIDEAGQMHIGLERPVAVATVQ
jgi:AhpD family alkylhydroperoxidase